MIRALRSLNKFSLSRRERALALLVIAAVVGLAAVYIVAINLAWLKSTRDEELAFEQRARALGDDVEQTFTATRDLLAELNRLDAKPCGPQHLKALQDAAIATPAIRAIGYWRGAERQCSAGFLQVEALTPPKADQIYPSGVIAWWPGPDTEAGGVQLFLMRLGNHDVAIDPRQLLRAGHLDTVEAALWVEGLRLAAQPADAQLPAPDTLDPGLTVDRENGVVMARFSLGTVLPIDIVAVEPLATFWERQTLPMLTATVVGVLFSALWLYGIFRFSRHQLGFAAELRDAIARQRLRVHYQPIVDLADGHCSGAEALVRWHHNGGDISPDVFIPLAEKTGLMPQLTQCVLQRILRDLGPLLKAPSRLCINLNLSRDDLEDPTLPDRIASQLAEAEVPDSAIKLEITERSLINSEAARNAIHRLRQRGHQVAIDDFGTGYSSLAYLESFELDTLKIDKIFVDSIAHDTLSSSVVDHIIEMAHSLRLDMVAEGIEHEHQSHWLRGRGVSHGQGFFYSKPLTAARFIRYYRNRRV